MHCVEMYIFLAMMQCVDEFTPCEIDTASLFVGPNTALTVSGGCELVVSATSRIAIYASTIVTVRCINIRNIYFGILVFSVSLTNLHTIQAPSISLTSRKDIAIYGHISTNGLGPLEGPGAPQGTGEVGWGGSYGGSGGRLNCDNEYFSNLKHQVRGSVHSPCDIFLSLKNTFSLSNGAFILYSWGVSTCWMIPT